MEFLENEPEKDDGSENVSDSDSDDENVHN